ncbi:hypothetical protein K503DRAFT_784386 [Rhizopogon vinicolor AM-OR11-026]|uniref:Uncharacterized protein n=1 Tax=Rhizopogon vinicolor AM-OR11-026 TaxID=1314800 RepID=A0A1B7MUV9_9AGAM|nr:hypothetical protein K503DRAFT_784386 [Rhizopogon vinicolor AM-OR11-026]
MSPLTDSDAGLAYADDYDEDTPVVLPVYGSQAHYLVQTRPGSQVSKYVIPGAIIFRMGRNHAIHSTTRYEASGTFMPIEIPPEETIFSLSLEVLESTKSWKVGKTYANAVPRKKIRRWGSVAW